MQIRPAAPDEIAACASLVGDGVRETFTWLSIAYPEVEFIRASESGELVFVAVEEERIVGVAGLKRDRAYLHYLFVRAGCRGRGLGSALLDHVEAICQAHVSLTVEALNTRGRAFYRRQGFRETDAGIGRDGSAWVRMSRLPPAAIG